MSNHFVKHQKQFLIRHAGNMGDMVFFVPPILETLKTVYPDCHITFITAWGFKEKNHGYGKRNQGGFCISLMMHNPHIDQLVHWHDQKTSLKGSICIEEGRHIPTWSREYYENQKKSELWDGVFELDVGIAQGENPMKRLYKHIGMQNETNTNYKLYFSDYDLAVAKHIMSKYPHPRIVLLEGLEGASTRGWDADKIPSLEHAISRTYSAAPIWFGAKYIHEYQGRPLTLRENIATLMHCDAAIGVLSGPLHFAAAVGLPVLTLLCDQPIHRADPAYFLNKSIADDTKKHRTLLGPTGYEMGFLKEGSTQINLTPAEWAQQKYADWNNPGVQGKKSCLSVITVHEIMAALADMVHNPSI
ncbi:MAG: hypothetical protein A3E36_00360 [Candidatus Andersenbacteria bacterium RIFCSPHIGHO2_12_FULL_45_11b]|uniref:Glycosyl transferase family 9 n=1 Tax=Candidatus Andersenbacteria bacterium RIFCSPHIGHO2_12_FULL_45_11b TaxID=1797282 RepID=A0A1G1XAJ8_9BACT|nr:MAG: hypothetical protein A3E36_00360 [Candidatus Andersenbacteria bacterium RIFCSPHIGHO2_12_FULL_45_11b]